jgi:hypothetical protein
MNDSENSEIKKLVELTSISRWLAVPVMLCVFEFFSLIISIPYLNWIYTFDATWEIVLLVVFFPFSLFFIFLPTFAAEMTINLAPHKKFGHYLVTLLFIILSVLFLRFFQLLVFEENTIFSNFEKIIISIQLLITNIDLIGKSYLFYKNVI